MEGNLYTESFFSKKQRDSNRIEFDFDEVICDRVMKSFLSDLQRFLVQHGLSTEIREDNDGLSFTDIDEDLAVKLINALKQFRKNVVKRYDGQDMIVCYNNYLIRYMCDCYDFGNNANIFFQDKVTSAYTKEQLLTFIAKTPSNNDVWCGKNYISSGLFSNTEKVAREIFGEDIIISKSAFNMVIEFPGDYTEDADYTESFLDGREKMKLDKYRTKASKKLIRWTIDFTGDYMESGDDEVYTEASLNDSDMFKQLNKSSSIMAKLKKALKESVVLDKSYIEEQYLQITKTRLSPLSEKVIKAFDDGEIKLIYSQTAKVTTALPFVVLQLEGKMSACIFIADFCSMNKDGTMLNIEMKKLYTLMESAYVGLKYFTNPNAFARSSRIAKVTASIYSEMSLRILNREFALSLDKDTYDTVNYLIARFCLEKVLPLSSKEVVHAYAVSCCKAPTNLSMELASDMYEREEIASVESLIKCISKNFPKMAKLTFRYYFQRWISSFGTGTCLAIDSFPYLYYTISNVTLGAFLVNVTGLSEIVKNAPGMSQFYAEISRVC